MDQNAVQKKSVQNNFVPSHHRAQTYELIGWFMVFWLCIYWL